MFAKCICSPVKENILGQMSQTLAYPKSPEIAYLPIEVQVNFGNEHAFTSTAQALLRPQYDKKRVNTNRCLLMLI